MLNLHDLKQPKFFFGKTDSRIYVFHISHSQMQKNRKVRSWTFQQSRSFKVSDVKIICFKEAPNHFRVSLKYFNDKCGVEGPDLVTFSEVPDIIQKVLQSIKNH